MTTPEIPKIAPLKWPSLAQQQDFFGTSGVRVIPYDEKKHALLPERKAELLEVLDAAGAGIIRLGDPAAAEAIARLNRGEHAKVDRLYSFTGPVLEAMQPTQMRIGYHVTDRLTYSVLSGHYMCSSERLPNPNYFEMLDDLDGREPNDYCREQLQKGEFQGLFYMAAALSEGELHNDLSDYLGGTERMLDLLRALRVEPTQHEVDMTDYYVLLGIDLKGYQEYERQTQLGGFVNQISPFDEDFAAILPPPPKYVKPLSLLTFEEPYDLCKTRF